MKANEAPEVLYFSPTSFEIGGVINSILTTKSEGDIEYTRTDAFIEKAVDWLEDNAIEYWGTEAVDNGMMMDDFKKAMKL